MLKLTQISIYPIKSLGGIELNKAVAQERGLEHDRRWMLVDQNGLFLSQRKYPKMALLKTSISMDNVIVTAPDHDKLYIPIENNSSNKIRIKVWNDECIGYIVGEDYDQWFSEKLEMKCRLVYMGDQIRYANPVSMQHNEKVSYADGYQYLLVGEESLNDLNNRLDESIPMNRFRPNLVFSGGAAYEEDIWNDFQIGDMAFYGIKPCSRCVLTTINQETALKGKEPLQTLSTFRKKENKIFFGLNVSVREEGIIKVGDVITILSKK